MEDGFCAKLGVNCSHVSQLITGCNQKMDMFWGQFLSKWNLLKKDEGCVDSNGNPTPDCDFTPPTFAALGVFGLAIWIYDAKGGGYVPL